MKIPLLILTAILTFSGCQTVSDVMPVEPCFRLVTTVSDVMPFEQWSRLITTEKAVLMYDPKYCKGKKLTVKYHGFLFEKRYKLSDGSGGHSLSSFWWMKMLILDPIDGRFKKLGKGDWVIKVYAHKDINGNIVKEYTK